MADHFAIKRLTASDCTLFEAVFRTIGAGNQKSINLNADVLIGRLYPNLGVEAAKTGNVITVSVAIYGPNAKPAHRMRHKITKVQTSKNWRLNGVAIPGPSDDSTRYDAIRPGDLAVMAFRGVETPRGLDLVLVSRAAPADAAALSALSPLIGRRSMIEVQPTQIESAIAGFDIADDHPVRLAAVDTRTESALEDAAQGGPIGTETLLRIRNVRPVSDAELAKAKANAARIGREGEALVNAWLAAEAAAGRLAKYTWVSAVNAVAPFDFESFSAKGERSLLDAKSTAGPFGNILHLSLAEIVAAAGDLPYRIVRVSELDDDGGRLRFSHEIGTFARTLKAIHEAHMPAGVRVDGFSVTTDALTWEPEVYVPWPKEEGESDTPPAPTGPLPP
jgi:hypothetical protein